MIFAAWKSGCRIPADAQKVGLGIGSGRSSGYGRYHVIGVE